MLRKCITIIAAFITGSVALAQNFESQKFDIPARIGTTAQNNIPIIDSFEIKMNPKVFEASNIIELNQESKVVWDQIVACSGSESNAKEHYRNGQICSQAVPKLSALKKNVEIYLASAFAFGPMFTIECHSAGEQNCESILKILKDEVTGQSDAFANLFGHDVFFKMMKPFGMHPFFNQLMLENAAAQQTMVPAMKMCGGIFCTDNSSNYWVENVFEAMMKYYMNLAMNYDETQNNLIAEHVKEQVARKYNERLKKEDQLEYSQIESRFRKSLMAYRILSLSLAGQTECSTWTLFPKQAYDYFQYGSKIYTFTTFEHKLLEARIKTTCGFSENKEQENYQNYLKNSGKGIFSTSFFLGSYIDKAKSALEFWKRLK